MKDENRMREAVRGVSPERFELREDDVIKALWIVYEADNLSSREREEGKGDFKKIRVSVEQGCVKRRRVGVRESTCERSQFP